MHNVRSMSEQCAAAMIGVNGPPLLRLVAGGVGAPDRQKGSGFKSLRVAQNRSPPDVLIQYCVN